MPDTQQQPEPPAPFVNGDSEIAFHSITPPLVCRTESDLPFVRKKRKGAHRCYWSVADGPKRFGDQWLIGRQYAMDLLRYMVEVGEKPTLIPRILADLPNPKQWTGMEAGFMDVLTRRLKHGPARDGHGCCLEESRNPRWYGENWTYEKYLKSLRFRGE